MARYNLTARRRAALRKAQLASARKRKLSPGHKRVIAGVVAGAVVAGGAWGAYNHFEKKVKTYRLGKLREQVRGGYGNLAGRRRRAARNSPDMTKRRVHHIGDLIAIEQQGSISFDSKEVKLKGRVTTFSKVQHPMAKAIMDELNGTPVKGGHARRHGGKYKVVFGERNKP